MDLPNHLQSTVHKTCSRTDDIPGSSRACRGRSRALSLVDSPHLLELAVVDPHPRVRREAVSALGQYGSAEAADLALRALDLPMDPFLDFALWRTCRILAPHWLPAFQRNEMNFGGNADRMAFALKAVEKPEVLAPLIELLSSGGGKRILLPHHDP